MADRNAKSGALPAEIRARLAWDDAHLLAECEVHTHRTGGPGGQHRNKVATAIRLVHGPSCIVVTAGETRSQHENRAQALLRLREAIAVRFRIPPPEVIQWPDSVRIGVTGFRVNEHNPGYPETLGIVLDVFAANGGRLADAAAVMGVSSSSLVRFLATHPRVWVAANEIRRHNNLKPLQSI
ncbi:MAG: peptide chain release factor-like protein [Planctomycetes bacterium]|nr:peptide chain release factor-like protein [Planctomycetota bacterium]